MKDEINQSFDTMERLNEEFQNEQYDVEAKDVANLN